MKSVLRIAAVSFLAALCAIAQGAPASPVADEKAIASIDRLSAFYKSLKSVSCTFTVHLASQTANGTDQLAIRYKVAAERPNKILFLEQNSRLTASVASDGKSTTVLVPETNKYFVDGPLQTLGEGIELSGLSGFTADLNSLLIDLLGPDPKAALIDGAKAIRYVGRETLNGIDHDRIMVAQEDERVEIWIQSGAQPFVSKVAPPKDSGAPEDDVTYELELGDWKANEPIAPGQFAITPPAEMTLAKSYEDVAGIPERPVLGLIGSPAPVLKLKKLDGSTLDLTSVIGKNVVLLDFWATYCPPCIRSLPRLAELAKDYKGKGVSVFAINEGETLEEVNAFLKAQGIEIDVGLDSDGSATAAYKAETLPTSIIIGRDGKIRHAHVGYLVTTERQFRHEIDVLLAEK